MLRDGKTVALIDFDELGKASFSGELLQIAMVVDFFKRESGRRDEFGGDVQFDQEVIKNFMTVYLAYNPYLTKSEFRNSVDFETAVIRRVVLSSIEQIERFCDKEDISDRDVERLFKMLDGREWMVSSIDPRNVEIKKDAMEIAYDDIFKKLRAIALLMHWLICLFHMEAMKEASSIALVWKIHAE